ncbi:hypothetical protein ASPCADRAFT_134409 [Aspergillus carbonarius ITEM 5010]|uniref:PBP domain-containing protein n=1 Tax=Aspergillus carbonarius (strain ITEM 5010) TaxID=602072 RepID=A0A1R3RA98_ASPC5|nr:hypothetical protein ASPCADRAFT_134409 [Aspergillus carbonarius ITEM 5010]
MRSGIIQLFEEFNSRSGSPATLAREAELWYRVNQSPWFNDQSPWCPNYVNDPVYDVSHAANNGSHILTEWSTYIAAGTEIQSKLTRYKSSQNNPDFPPMPAHLLVSARSKDLDLAKEFAKWATGPQGREVVAKFQIDGQLVYADPM